MGAIKRSRGGAGTTAEACTELPGDTAPAGGAGTAPAMKAAEELAALATLGLTPSQPAQLQSHCSGFGCKCAHGPVRIMHR